MAIEGISGLAPAVGAIDPKPQGASAVSGLGDSFGKILDAASASDQGANTAVGRMLDGSGDVHEAMIALQQADLMLQFTVQVRNKFVQAYQEIMRMPV
jgi:flagellar hook-basal body complex protein FliE